MTAGLFCWTIATVGLWTGVSAVGLVFDFVGGLLVAYEIWAAPPESLDAPGDVLSLLIGLIESLRSPPPHLEASLQKVSQQCSALALHETAQRSRGSNTHHRIRTTGRVGLVLVLLGFAGQLIGTIGSGIHSGSLTGQTPSPATAASESGQ